MYASPLVSFCKLFRQLRSNTTQTLPTFFSLCCLLIHCVFMHIIAWLIGSEWVVWWNTDHFQQQAMAGHKIKIKVRLPFSASIYSNVASNLVTCHDLAHYEWPHLSEQLMLWTLPAFFGVGWGLFICAACLVGLVFIAVACSMSGVFCSCSVNSALLAWAATPDVTSNNARPHFLYWGRKEQIPILFLSPMGNE